VDRHLNELEANEVLAGNVSPEVASHLAACALCRSSRDEMEHLLRALTAEADHLSEKPDAFWLAQQRQISSRILPPRRRYFAPRYAWAAVAAILIVGIAFLLKPGTPPKVPAPVAIAAENDQQLMIDVEQTLNSDVAPPLEPAQVLVQAMTQTSSNHPATVSKETRNEN